MTENTYRWEQLSQHQRNYIVVAHAAALNVKKKGLYEIFNVGKPTVVIGENDGKPYCRIAAESVDVMNVLVREYAEYSGKQKENCDESPLGK